MQLKQQASNKKIVAISGSTGLVGHYVSKFLKKKGYTVVPITRKEFALSDEDFAKYLSGIQFIVHLAGESVVGRWTAENKEKILNSRVSTTLKIARAVQLLPVKPEKVISASAIGIYDYVGVHDESSTAYGNTFLTDVVKKWEEAADQIASAGVKVCKCRIGVVMSDKGGALAKILDIHKYGFGVRIGNGNQVMSFIHIHDLARSIGFLLRKTQLEGVFNLVSPEMTTNKQLNCVLSKVYKKVPVIPVPKFFFKLALGEASTLLVNGESVVPERLKKEGFDFTFPNIENVLFYLLA